MLDLVKKILSRLDKPYYGSSLARIAVEVGEEEDIRLLVQAEREDKKYDAVFDKLSRVDWNETAEDEDPAILWALKNEKFGIVDILMAVNKINLQGDPSADLTINCDSETFRVHKYFLCSKSPVFRARLERWESEGEININTMNSDTLSSMIHYIYTGELADGWQDLDIRDLAEATDKYDLPGWMMIFCSKLNLGEVPAEKVAEMIIAGSRYQHTAARELRLVARNKIRKRRELTADWAFRERLLEELLRDIWKKESSYFCNEKKN